jgi:hypothetical protein
MTIRIWKTFVKEGDYYNYYNDQKVLIMSVHTDIVLGGYKYDDGVIVGITIQI